MKAKSQKESTEEGLPSTEITQLKAPRRNPRRHTDRGIKAITEGIKQFGAARSIVIDENDVVLAGNGTVKAAKEAGLTKVQIVEADGQTLIAVRRTGLSEEEKEDLALRDNRSHDLNGYDAEVLAAFDAENKRLGELFTPNELQRIYDQDTSFLDRFLAPTAGENGVGDDSVLLMNPTANNSQSGVATQETSAVASSGGSAPSVQGDTLTATSNNPTNMVSLLFVMNVDQRSEVLQVLNAVKDEQKLSTTGEALYYHLTGKR